MGKRDLVDAFVSDLARSRVPRPFRNPYRQPEAAHNLRTFLLQHDPRDSTLLLVGEAPGYRGAAVSGVAFCSVSTLTSDWNDPWRSFGHEAGYQAPAETPYVREATATIVWACLSDILRDLPIPLTWNAVPFHPAGSSEHSNAPLRKSDVSLGHDWLERMLDLFPNSHPVAVGRRAADALSSLGIDRHEVRHPSRGGKRDFRLGLARIRQQVA